MENHKKTEKRSDFAGPYGLLELFVALAVMAIFVVVVLEILSRYVLLQSIAWSSELCQTLLVWITFVGAAAALRTDGHMEITMVLNRIHSARAKKVILILRDLAILAFVCVGTVGGLKLVMRTWKMTTTTLQIPAGVLYLAFPVGCAFMIPLVLHRLYKLFTEKG